MLSLLRLCRLLHSFQNNLDEITIIATPDDEDGNGQTHLSKAVQLHSFLDPAKGVTPCLVRLSLLSESLQT